VPTAGDPYSDAYWVGRRREWLARNGFRFDDLDLADSTAAEVRAALVSADLVYVEGGNTYYLLMQMQRTGFWDAMREAAAIYAGNSAGAIVACPDIRFIGDLDDPGKAPDLGSTAGAGLVEFGIMPHMDDERAQPTISRTLGQYSGARQIVGLNDDQALLVKGPLVTLVHSPDGDLVGH
jgi:dipeptidase E